MICPAAPLQAPLGSVCAASRGARQLYHLGRRWVTPCSGQPCSDSSVKQSLVPEEQGDEAHFFGNSR